jgi:7-keto-8-aminopelargonate synthetase-like enzyme
MTTYNWMKAKVQAARAHQYKAFEEINSLVLKERQGKKVTLCNESIAFTEFISCSYLGLDQDPRLIKAMCQDSDKFGVSFHAARTRMQPENNLILESLLQELYFASYPVVFPALHMAHLGLLPLLASGEMPSFPMAKNGIVFILDKTVHSSIQVNRGLLAQFGELMTLDFQQLDALRECFITAFNTKRSPIAIGESVGSMGGITPVTELLSLAEKYNGYVYLDDAHGTSIHGQQGCGYVLKCLDYRFHPRLILTATLGKAFGALGGVVLLPTLEDRNFTVRFAPTYVFGGPPALSIVNAAIASAEIHLTDEIFILQKQLWDNVNHFDSLIAEYTVNANTPSPIRGIFIGDEFKAIQFSKELKQRGFLLTTAMYPTVAKKKSILRAGISALHSKEDITALCASIKEIRAFSL